MDPVADARAPAREGPPIGDDPRSSERQDGAPYLTLNGFAGPLDNLLTLARSQKIDVAAISLTELLDQLTAALRLAPTATPLGEKADWVVMAAWLVQLRTRLLLPADAPGQQEAAIEADQLRSRLVALKAMQALTGWLERQPRLGFDVFARGRSEMIATSVEPGAAVDVVEFLWASLALFDDEDPTDTSTMYRPAPPALHTVAEARTRILRRLNEIPDGVTLDELLPPDEGHAGAATLLRRSGWAATFVAGLELAKQGQVVMGQGEDFGLIRVVMP